MNDTDSYNFKLSLKDEESAKPISGAVYDITITDGTTTRKVTGRVTDNNGMLSTRLVPADNLTITIKEVKSKVGYVIDTNEQTIELQKKNGVYTIVNQNPYDYSDNKNGAIIQDKEIIFNHTNVKKDNDSVILNLYINKMDEKDMLLPNVKVRISSDTLKNSNG